MIDWIKLHYQGKEGIIYTEFKIVGDFLVEHCGALPIGERETDIGIFYSYHVTDLAKAYNGMYIAWRIYRCE